MGDFMLKEYHGIARLVRPGSVGGNVIIINHYDKGECGATTKQGHCELIFILY